MPPKRLKRLKRLKPAMAGFSVQIVFVDMYLSWTEFLLTTVFQTANLLSANFPDYKPSWTVELSKR